MFVHPGSLNKASKMLWPATAQYPELAIPTDWPNLEEFVQWYMSNKKPMFVPHDAITMRTDDATALTIFRSGSYQVELYIIHPNKVIPIHAHPGMEVITITMGGGSVCGDRGAFGHSLNMGLTSPKLLEGEYHGGKPTGQGGGFLLLSFEKFLRGTALTSAAIQWKGPTAGPIHDELLARHYNVPTAIEGVFDATPFTK